jgi:hypothetical protein
MSKPIETVAVCGVGGAMGAGIVAARAGSKTICYGTAAASLHRAEQQLGAPHDSDDSKAQAIDMTFKLGLGYPDRQIERVECGGLTHRYGISQTLFETYGTPAYAPARRAVVAKPRAK